MGVRLCVRARARRWIPRERCAGTCPARRRRAVRTRDRAPAFRCPGPSSPDDRKYTARAAGQNVRRSATSPGPRPGEGPAARGYRPVSSHPAPSGAGCGQVGHVEFGIGDAIARAALWRARAMSWASPSTPATRAALRARASVKLPRPQNRSSTVRVRRRAPAARPPCSTSAALIAPLIWMKSVGANSSFRPNCGSA